MATRRKEPTRRQLYKRRAFLNPPKEGGIAAIDAAVIITESDTSIEVDANLGLSDCSNHIYLDFTVWDSSNAVQYLKGKRDKAKKLRATINDYLDAVEKAYKEVEKKSPAKEKARKALEKKRKKKKVGHDPNE